MSTRLERLIQIDAAIRTGRYPGVQRLMAQFEIGERTIRGDLAFLRERCNAPLAYDRGRSGYYYTDPAWTLPTMLVTEGEVLAMLLSAELSRRYLGTSFEQPLRKAIAHLSQQLPDQVQLDLHSLATHTTFQPGAAAGADPTLVLALNRAIHERHPVEMTYYTAGRNERNRRVIEPYHLYNVRGEWQVIAFDHLRGQFRNFAVVRIEAWHVRTHERFARDPAFSAERYLANGFVAEHGGDPQQIEIWFDALQARYIREREWHPTQTIHEHPDGTLTLRFSTGALDEVQRWVMSYGAHARVLAPASLAQAVADAAAAMVARYRER